MHKHEEPKHHDDTKHSHTKPREDDEQIAEAQERLKLDKAAEEPTVKHGKHKEPEGKPAGTGAHKEALPQ